MAKDKSVANPYEEARKQRLEENKKRFEDLGIAKISKSLTEFSSSANKTQQSTSRPRQKTIYAIEPRRSSRVRNQVTSYQDDLDIKLPRTLKGSRLNSSWASYIARPLHECKTASYDERAEAFKVAEEFRSHLESGNPSFVKTMVRSHVYSCFWLGLPSKFCADHLSEKTVEMVLEDEKGQEYDATYIGKRTGISGGWRGFALDHKLDDGDAVVFELVEPNRFKVYIFRVSSLPSQQRDGTKSADEEEATSGAKRKMKAMKFESPSDQKQTKQDKSADDTRRAEPTEAINKRSVHSKSRKKASPRLLRRRA